MSLHRSHQRVTLAELGEVNSLYLATAATPDDPTLVWGSSFQTEALEEFARTEALRSNTLITTTHVLLKAVATAIGRHPHFNRRIIGRRVIVQNEINVAVPVYMAAQRRVTVVWLTNIAAMGFAEISRHMMRGVCGQSSPVASAHAQSRLRQKWQAFARYVRQVVIFCASPIAFSVFNHTGLSFGTVKKYKKQTCVMVNVFNYVDAPPMQFFKPSCLSANFCSVHVSIGPATMQPVIVDGKVVARRVATLFVRGDHRLVDTPQIASFVSTLRNLLHNPESICQATGAKAEESVGRRVA